jgi:pSer/pThr/pTyr-binding forkhead associated (FHA) protein
LITKIGRGVDNDVCLKDDVYVSGHHAEIYFQDNQCWLRDLGSRNGSMRNSDAISEPVIIKPGDILTFGRARFEVL